MNSALKRKSEKIDKLIQKLVSRSELGIPIIVEGRKDKVSLRRLGVRGEIYCIKSTGLKFLDFVEKISSKRETIILTDFDKEGKDLLFQHVRELTRIHTKADDSFWRQLKSLGRSEIRSVEELADYVNKLRLTNKQQSFWRNRLNL